MSVYVVLNAVMFLLVLLIVGSVVYELVPNDTVKQVVLAIVIVFPYVMWFVLVWLGES